MLVTRQLMAAIDPHCIVFFVLYGSQWLPIPFDY